MYKTSFESYIFNNLFIIDNMEIKHNPKWNQFPHLRINNISLNQDKVKLTIFIL